MIRGNHPLGFHFLWREIVTQSFGGGFFCILELVRVGLNLKYAGKQNYQNICSKEIRTGECCVPETKMRGGDFIIYPRDLLS